MDPARRTAKASQPHRCKQKMRITLAPVLEHYEGAPADVEKASQPPMLRNCNEAMSSKKTKPMRILSKLRDGYVKLMNDMASRADFAGASSLHGCPQGVDCAAFAVAKAVRSLQREEQEALAMAQTLAPSLSPIRC